MRTCLLWLACLTVAGCSGRVDSAKHNQFFRDWLTKHGEKEVVVDADGVGIAASPTRLKTSVYGTNKHDSGCSVELEFKIRLPGGEEIIEYVAGMGQTEEQAIEDALANFTASTFHVVYKAFMNPADPHQRSFKATVGNKQRDVLPGELYLQGTQESQGLDFESLRPQIAAAIEALPLTDGPHWIKIVYGQNAGQPITVAATLDNQDAQELTEAIGKLPWPKSDGFYMVKHFIVIK